MRCRPLFRQQSHKRREWPRPSVTNRLVRMGLSLAALFLFLHIMPVGLPASTTERPACPLSLEVGTFDEAVLAAPAVTVPQQIFVTEIAQNAETSVAVAQPTGLDNTASAQRKAARKKTARARSDGQRASKSENQNKLLDTNSPQFIRLQRKKDELQFLQTAIVTYAPKAASEQEGEEGKNQREDGGLSDLPADLRVDLVGVIHVAERTYYEELNRRLRKYDVVLYELVAPEGTRARPGERPVHPVSLIQKSMTEFLGLTYQLDAIDYHRPNFVHADMSPEELTQAMEKKGETVWSMFLRAFGYEFARSQLSESGTTDIDFLAALFSKNRQLEMKRLFAQQLADDIQGQIRALEGPQGSALISSRNEKVLQVLQKQIGQGHQQIAIFYGAGHMYHFHERLVALGLTPVRTRWLNAWDLRASTSPSKE